MTQRTVQQINLELKERAKNFNVQIECGGDGDVFSEIAIIGEHPGERELSLQMPFSGGSGKILWTAAQKHGLTRRNTYTTNVIKRQLMGSGKFKEKVKAGELDIYQSFLLWELSQLPNLKYILVLGNSALQGVMGIKGIMQYRGSVFDKQFTFGNQDNRKCNVKVAAALNPAAILRMPKHQLMFDFDIRRFKSVIDGTFEVHDITAHINPSYEQALAWIDKMRNDQKPISFDVETSSSSVICYGLANSIYEGMCINLRNQTGNRFTVEEELDLLLALEDLLCHEDTQLVMQNGMYDASYSLFMERVRLTGYYFDTMLAHHALYPSLPHNLGFITTQYTTQPFYKDEGKLWKETGDIDAEWRYNVKDCCVTLEAHYGMHKELKAAGMEDFFFNHVMKIQPELVKMTVGGLLIDGNKKQQLATQLEGEIEQLKTQYDELVEQETGDPDFKPNPKSPKQMSELFFTRLRLTGKGVSTDVKNRKYMHDHPRTTPEQKRLITIIDKMAEENKFLSTYVKMRLDDDGRIRSEYKQMGVVNAPGRLSSSQTGWETGTNLQNQPKRAKEMFIADEGYEFNYFDLSQAEARLVAWLYPIPKWIEEFELARSGTDFDCHRSLAASMYNMDYKDVPRNDIDPETGKHTIRYISKRCRHGLNYRMMAARLAEVLGITYSEAEAIWHLYHKINPEIALWWQATVERVRTTGKLVNPYGRRWMLLERFDDEALESVVAFVPQSSIGDKVNQIIYQCHNDPRWPTGEARICLNEHDALTILNKKGLGHEVRAIAKEHAESPIIVKAYDNVERELIIPAEFKVSQANEQGLHRLNEMKGIEV